MSWTDGQSGVVAAMSPSKQTPAARRTRADLRTRSGSDWAELASTPLNNPSATQSLAECEACNFRHRKRLDETRRVTWEKEYVEADRPCFP